MGVLAVAFADDVWYDLDGEERILDGAPCGCPACDDGVQPGHFACSCPPAALLEGERDGRLHRFYDDGAWRWALLRDEAEWTEWLEEKVAFNY